MRDEPGFDGEAPAADVWEQRRLVVEDDLDPERTVTDPVPDATSLHANPADVHDQTIEVRLDDDDDEDALS